MTAQKVKNIWLQAALRDFWSYANAKLKQMKFVKTFTSSGPYGRKCKNIGF